MTRSLAYKTDLAIRGSSGVVVDRGDYIKLETPGNPTYFWGNMLLFPEAPEDGALERWTELFHSEFPNPEVRHLTFGIDTTDGAMEALEPFRSSGFAVEASLVLSTTEPVQPQHFTEGFDVRRIETDAEWAAVVDLQVACRETVFADEPKFRRFKRVQMEEYRAFADLGNGAWWGGYIDGELVADLGVFCIDGTARFQSVETHPNFRRMGICSTLLYQACIDTAQERSVSEFVIVADDGGPAIGAYSSVGFTLAERQVGVCKWPRHGWES